MVQGQAVLGCGLTILEYGMNFRACSDLLGDLVVVEITFKMCIDVIIDVIRHELELKRHQNFKLFVIQPRIIDIILRL